MCGAAHLPAPPAASPRTPSARPRETDYLYYVLKANGEEHFFTSNYNEFLEWKQKRDAALNVEH
jgi:cell division protein YceG involved in septum cleavage